MSSRGAVLPVIGVALLAAGFGVGLFVSGSRATRVVTIETTATPAPAPAATEPVAAPAAAPAPAAPAAPAAESSAASLSPEDRDALRAILDQLPRDPVPTGSGSITGQVKTEDGNPVPGVEVSFWPERPRAAGTRPPVTRINQRDPEDAAVDSFLHARWYRAATRSAMTDAAGRYRVEGLAEDLYRGMAMLPGWSFQQRPMSDGYRAGAVVDFIATPSIEVSVEISCADGSMPEQLLVRGTDPRSGGWGVRPHGSTIRLKPGKHEMLALGGVQETHRSDPQALDLVQGAAPPTLRFVLKARPGIRGRLIHPDGMESESGSLVIQRLADGARPDPVALRSSGRQVEDRRPRHGSFFIPDLAPGRYALGAARSSGGPIVAIEEVEVGSAQVERDIRLPSPEPEEFVAVTVLGPGGEVLRDYTVTTGWKSGGSSSSGGSTVLRRSDGSRWVFHHDPRGGEGQDAMHSITVTSREHGTATLEYSKGERTEWTVRLEPPARVDARVTGMEGTAYHGRLHLHLAAPSAETHSFHFSSDQTVDASGLQSFTSIQPGEYALVLTMAYGQSHVPIARLPVTVRSGRNEFAVPLPRLHELVVTGAEGNVGLRSASEPRFWIHAPATEGRAVFDGIPEGEYVVNANRKQQTFRVSGPTKVEL